MSSLPFDESDYRSVLRKWVAGRPNRGRGELKSMAEKLGVPSPVFSQMLSGTRELTEDHAYLLCDHMSFIGLQSEYFLTLVQFERASHFSYKEHLKKKLIEIREKSLNLSTRLNFEEKLSDQVQAEFYSSWLYSAVRLFCDLKKGTSLDEIAKEFHLPRERALQVVQFLIKNGLLKIENSLYFMGPARTHVDRNSPYVTQHHSNWRVRALEKAQGLKDNELMFTGPMTLSEKDFSQLREKMVNLIQEISETVKKSPSEKLACFNLDFFEVRS